MHLVWNHNRVLLFARADYLSPLTLVVSQSYHRKHNNDYAIEVNRIYKLRCPCQIQNWVFYSHHDDLSNMHAYQYMCLRQEHLKSFIIIRNPKVEEVSLTRVKRPFWRTVYDGDLDVKNALILVLSLSKMTLNHRSEGKQAENMVYTRVMPYSGYTIAYSFERQRPRLIERKIHTYTPCFRTRT